MIDRNPDIMALLERAPGKRPHFLEEASLDHMFTMIIELASQTWVLRERLYAHEALDGRREAVEAWQPTTEQAAELARMREDMLRDLFRTVLARVPGDSMPDHTADPLPPM
ncbi:hypothetical protein [Polymorphobacter sp.]|uniref:hypothetical protein n=1 Tax=Polymorphobacter sp. TaxID=1909290 RepID=UPI003F7114E0